ncbi:MAG: tRNA lysidine(34) synthetase TilS [Propionibacteriales bacterium]|nr:tRNA lysidine(34) synthetase TilS [Propionibacteriales bacterium]
MSDVGPGRLVLVACSGGPDSTALAMATRFESRRAGWRVGAAVVDHGLQDGSDRVAARAAEQLRSLGLDPVDVIRVDVPANAGGPEAAARRARYDALEAAAERHEAACVLLGHTRDDQAETVLLGLARGSGARSLGGMAPRSGRYRRPLLDVPRAATEKACAAESLEVWRDPQNADPAYTRARVRDRVLPLLERELGPGIVDALARTADLLRDDADALDALAGAALADSRTDGRPDDDRTDDDRPRVGLDVATLTALPPAVRTRVLRLAALEAGAPATELFARHVDAMDGLVMDWRGQRGVDLPGGVRVSRARGVLRFGA